MKNTLSVFDVIGPIMIGPSSSHTAGACKLGYISHIIFGGKPKKCRIDLHGSFGKVYKGHCTDLAIIGGILGMIPSDPRISDAYEIAEKEGIEIKIKRCNLLGRSHPNTARIHLYDDNRKQVFVGSSLGGGQILLTEIDKVQVELTGAYSSLLVCYDNNIFNVTNILKLTTSKSLSIIRMETSSYKEKSIIDVEIKGKFDRKLVLEIAELEGVYWSRFINHISKYSDNNNK